MEMTDDTNLLPAETTDSGKPDEQKGSPAERKLVEQIISSVKSDKRHHEKAFKRMRRDMFVATNGREETWSEDNYRANISGRHVKQKTAALYAKNPKAVARRRETLDFTVWDETQESLLLAMQTVQTGSEQMAMAQANPQIDPMTGMPAQPELPPGFEDATAIIADFQQGMERRNQIKKLGRTLEILFSHATRNQKPLEFKAAMKQVVRRACTTGVGYVELGFQRETGPRPGLSEQLADFRARLAHLKRLAEEVAEGDIQETDAEIAELEKSVNALMQEPEIVLREGLIFDFPQSTKVIPDQLCTQLMGFVGARHLTIEYNYTKDEVREIFGVDLGSNYTPYTNKGRKTSESTSWNEDDGQGDLFESGKANAKEMVCVWKRYDKLSGLVYFVCDGHKGFLREPASPDVFVEDFWPIYALTFNAVENEDDLFPPSDVTLLSDVQNEINRSRQGKREHREAARPRWVYPRGVLSEENIASLKRAKAFDALGIDVDRETDMKTVFQAVPVPGVDPNLYDTNEVWSDAQVVVGVSEAAFGGLSKATATESAIAANSMTSTDGASIDALDTFLSAIAQAAGQILLREMSEEQAKRIAGPGAVWIEASMEDIYDELYLEVEAGSTGKPNQAVEINNWKELLPYLLQLPSIKPEWLARETLRRLDDKMDLTEAVVAGIPAIVAQNRMSQVGTGDPASDPNQQGGQGGDNAPDQPQEQSAGTGPAFGSNQM